MNPLIDNFVGSKRVAIVGASRSGKRFGNIACKELLTKGYEIYPVHPMAHEIDGVICYPDLKGLQGEVDALLISISPAKVPDVLEVAAQIGIKNIWLQQGSWSKEAQLKIDQLGLSVVSHKCILMYAPPVRSIHQFHRTIKGLFGGL